MEFFLSKEDISEVRSDSVVLFRFEEEKTPAGVRKLDRKLDGFLSEKIKLSGFSGAFGQTVSVDTPGSSDTKTVVLVGLGKKKRFEALEAFRAAKIVVAKTGKSSRTLCVDFSGVDRKFFRPFLEGAESGAYGYEKLKSSGGTKNRIEKIGIVSRRISADYFDSEESYSRAVSDSVAFARDLVNDPPNMMTPSILAERALSIAEDSESIECEVLDEEQIRSRGMGGLLAVSLGSSEPPRFIHLTYSPPRKSRKKVAIVGKGITFDSGGLCIKPADGMRTMKMDMAGAAVVLGSMKAIGELAPRVNVHGIVPATENMTGGSAYKPDDVVKALNGKTIEIINTDAEGRVALSDALSYAVKLGVSEIVDLATLTGACIVGLGLHNAGVMGNTSSLVRAVLGSARDVGEKMWELPLDEELREEIKSRVADVKNVGSRWGGAITAALFLENFVSETPWVHIDIAGPSYVEKPSDWNQYGASGFGVRTIVDYLMKK